MMNAIRRLLTVPDFGNEDANRRAIFLNRFDLIVATLLTASLVIYAITGVQTNTLQVLLGLLGVVILSFFLLRMRLLFPAGLVVVIIGWTIISVQAYNAEGIRDVIIIAYIAVAFLAALFLGWRSAAFTILASIAAIWVIAYAESQGRIVPTPQTPLNYARDLTVIFLVIASLVYFLNQNLRTALDSATKSTRELEARNAELQSIRLNLESQVQERTQELARNAERFSARAKKYEAVVQVYQNTSSIDNLADLLSDLAFNIHEKFGYYHIGIFLLDETRDYINLIASNSPIGQALLMRNTRIPAASDNIIAEVCATRRTRIVFDSDENAAFSSPDLTETRSEIALPLRIGNEILGVLDIHSQEPEAFGDADVETLNLLATQISSAIANVRLLEKSRRELEEARRTYQTYLRQEWSRFVQKQNIVGYQYAQNRIEPLTASAELPPRNPSEVVIPVMLRGEVLGEISIDTGGRPWNDEDYALVRAAAERAALGLENARLIDTTRQRAQLERTIADLGATISASTDLDAIMRMTVEELGKTLSAPEVFIRLSDAQTTRDT
ncbi:MAG: GAF domain-containing protein [Anaerolineales bacterium]